MDKRRLVASVVGSGVVACERLRQIIRSTKPVLRGLNWFCRAFVVHPTWLAVILSVVVVAFLGKEYLLLNLVKSVINLVEDIGHVVPAMLIWAGSMLNDGEVLLWLFRIVILGTIDLMYMLAMVALSASICSDIRMSDSERRKHIGNLAVRMRDRRWRSLIWFHANHWRTGILAGLTFALASFAIALSVVDPLPPIRWTYIASMSGAIQWVALPVFATGLASIIVVFRVLREERKVAMQHDVVVSTAAIPELIKFSHSTDMAHVETVWLEHENRGTRLAETGSIHKGSTNEIPSWIRATNEVAYGRWRYMIASICTCSLIAVPLYWLLCNILPIEWSIGHAAGWLIGAYAMVLITFTIGASRALEQVLTALVGLAIFVALAVSAFHFILVFPYLEHCNSISRICDHYQYQICNSAFENHIHIYDYIRHSQLCKCITSAYRCADAGSLTAYLHSTLSLFRMVDSSGTCGYLYYLKFSALIYIAWRILSSFVAVTRFILHHLQEIEEDWLLHRDILAFLSRSPTQ